ncbi:MAG: hypothetical protein ABUT20_14930 [Bacteroidota bacterium]
MKKQFAFFLIFLATVAIVFPACQKDDNLPVIKTNTQLITQSAWRFSSAKVGGLDVSASLQACQKDNVMTFVSAGTGTVDEGPAKCNPGSDPQTISFTWNFATNETVLHVSTVLFAGGSSDFSLVTLNDTQLVVSQMITVGSSSQTVVVTFIH